MRKLSSSMLLILFLMGIIIVAFKIQTVEAAEFNGIGNYGAEGGGPLDGKDASWIATSYDMAQMWPASGSKVQQIHALKPDFVALLYRDIMAVYNWDGTDEISVAIANDWIMKDQNGVLLKDPVNDNYYYSDFFNPSYQQYVANRCKPYIDTYGFDGIMLDNGMNAGAYPWLWESQTGLPATSPYLGRAPTDQDVRNAYVACHNTLRSVIGSNKVILPNGIWNGQAFFDSQWHSGWLDIFQRSQLNGHGGEGCLNIAGVSGSDDEWDNPVTWKQTVDMIAWSQTNYPDYYIAIASNFPDEKFAIYSMLLAVSGPHVCLLDFTHWSDDGAVTKSDLAFTKTLGQPRGPYTYNQATGVYSRDFDHGTINVNPSAHSYFTTGNHRIAMTRINPYRAIVGSRTVTSINATIANRGDWTETINVTLYCDSTAIGTQTVTLNNGSSVTLNFSWNTTGLPLGNYTVRAEASQVLGETDTADNSLSCKVQISIPGDINGDGKVDMRDVGIVVKAFGIKPGETKWTANGDLDENGVIDMRDIAVPAKEFGKSV